MNSNTDLKLFLTSTKPTPNKIKLPKHRTYSSSRLNKDTIKPLIYQDFDINNASSPTNRIIYYYQTLNGLQDILNEKSTYITHIHLASFHFGYTSNNEPYLHLNDTPPEDPKFDKVWEELAECKKRGIKIICMLGGAGGAFNQLFNNYQVFYNMWCKFIMGKCDLIDGVDFDVEESIGLDNIIKVIRDTMNTFDNNINWKDTTTGLSKFIISMAPVSYALESNTEGMGGFSYKELCQHPEGQRINYFNGQFYYGDFDVKYFEECISNGFSSNKVVMGCIEKQFTNWSSYYNILENLKKSYPNCGGVFFWEYWQHPPQWDYNVWLAFHSNYNTSLNLENKSQISHLDDNYCSNEETIEIENSISRCVIM